MKEQCTRYEKAYIQTGAESEFSIESIFNGYKIERYIKALDSHPKSDALVRMAENGKIYYGKSAKCDQYYIFRYEKYRLAYSTIM